MQTLRLIVAAVIGMIANQILTVELVDRWHDDEHVMIPAIVAMAMSVIIEVIAWELLGMVR